MNAQTVLRYRAWWCGPADLMPHGTAGTAWIVQHSPSLYIRRPWRFQPDGVSIHYMCERSDLELPEVEDDPG